MVSHRSKYIYTSRKIDALIMQAVFSSDLEQKSLHINIVTPTMGIVWCVGLSQFVDARIFIIYCILLPFFELYLKSLVRTKILKPHSDTHTQNT